MRTIPSRRGVLLLVVLSVLVLFVLVCTSFIMLAGHYRRGAVAKSRAVTVPSDPRCALDRALYQLVRGTNRSSSLFGHSLLEDLYGNDGKRGIVTGLGEDDAGRVSVIRFRPDGGQVSEIPSFYNGLLLTLLDGPHRGCSTRIVGSRPGILRVEPLVAENGSKVFPSVGGRLQINGRPFNGTGAGYNAASGKLDAMVTGTDGADGIPVALVPHLARFSRQPAIDGGAMAGGADESWDVADYQNMFLAAPALGIPSFHRPSLIAYWMSNEADRWDDPGFSRLAILRPTPYDHPNFSGSNLAMEGPDLFSENVVHGPWDVDNDGDGTSDSIWLDLGMPAESTPDGRPFKPLFAILCVDLDGRLNVNAHANSAQLESRSAPVGAVLNSVAGSPAAKDVRLPTGRGAGLAEVHLSPVFGSDVKDLLFGQGTRWGRYGADQRPGSGQIAGSPEDGAGVGPAVVQTGLAASGRDIHGVRSVVLDQSGYPLTVTLPFATRETQDLVRELGDPYATDPLRSSRAEDATFTIAEMERLLRFADIDSVSLPGRLASLAHRTLLDPGSPGEAARRRSLFTTLSVDVRVPGLMAPPWLRRQGTYPGHIVDWMWNRLSDAGVPEPSRLGELNRIVSAELQAGRRMSINPAFGNGRDDDANGVVDEPAESRGRSQSPDTLITNSTHARQDFARQLFCLMMILTDREDSEATPQQREMFTWRLAQWAINVVDFRDQDSIMSPFEFDIRPLDGWQAMDGDVATDEGGDRRVVWGCEYPELLITETLALHDRRVRDTDNDNGPHEKRWIRDGQAHEDVEGDADLDQYRIPRGELYIEVYATRGAATKSETVDSPAELYEAGRYLDLGRLAPAGDDGLRHPVWRLVITQENVFDLADRRPDLWVLHPRPEQIDRTIWFANHDPRGHPDEHQIYFNRSRSDPQRLARGHYAVVGPREIVGAGGNDVLAAAKPPPEWLNPQQTAPNGIGISVSEPSPAADYYPEPTARVGPGPLDGYAPAGATRALPDHPFDNAPGRPLGQVDVPSSGTVANFRSVLLQRLADPLNWHQSQRNPYVTVDWAAIDLTVYNSQDRPPADFPSVELGPFDPSHSASPDLPLRFASRQRGGLDGNIWTPEAKPAPETLPPGSALADHLRDGPEHTLGRLNSALLPPGLEPLSRGLYTGAPSLPFPWITWFDGPFVSPLDLLLVPSSSPSRLLHEFSVAAHFGAPTSHLLDFFHRADDRAPQLFRIFDYVDVMPPPVDRRDNDVATETAIAEALRSGLVRTGVPPDSRYPGRINVNTIVDPLVWRGVAKNFPPMDSDAFFSRIVQSREGFAGKPSTTYPTRFANPFRAASSADLMPLPQLRRKNVEATWLRSDPIDRRRPLFTADAGRHPEVLRPYRNQNRNAFFYYQGLLRLGNLLTTQSNVFAVWITVGYFEVQPHQVDVGHPDGLQLGRELGEETGQITRHRAFYMVDRSIPVAFESGRNHNVDRVILLRRFIE